MGSPALVTKVVKDDWVNLNRVLRKLAFSALGPDSIPRFNGIQFNTDFEDGNAEGRLQWNSEDGTLEVGMPGGAVNLQIGQEMLIRVTNGTGSTIANGAPVFVSGASGVNVIVGLADADFATGIGLRTIAVATEAIDAGQKGYVTTEGLVRDVDTSIFATEGVPVYLAKGGGLAVAPPTPPDITFVIGVVVRKHATEGILLILQTSLPNLSDLSDVDNTREDNDILQWNSSTNIWSSTKDLLGLETINVAGTATVGDLEVTNGAITSATGLINFDDENLETTGLGTFDSLEVTSGIIKSASGTIDFDDENVTTTGLLDIGGLLSSTDPPFAGGAIAVFSKDVDDITGIGISNLSLGILADQRMAMVDTTGHYLAFALPGVGNTGVLFGKNRSSAAFLFNAGGTGRDLVIGTVLAKDLFFGTTNLIRMAIFATGEASIYNGLRVGDTAIPTEMLEVVGNMVLPKTAGNGVKVDTTTPTFGFRDLLGQVIVSNTGATKPTHVIYRGTLRAYRFGAGDEEYFEFHIPHDHVPGTDIFIHVHWSHNSALVTGGTVLFEHETSYAKGHNQAAFPAPVSGTITGTASTTQYQQILSEVQLSASSPSGSQIDTADLEPDGIILMRFGLQTNSITSSGAVPDPFIHYVDIHYQSTNMATKDKAPDFYA